MAFTRKSAKDTARRVLADSANAKQRFGFGGDPGSVIGDNSPKHSDLWFLEFTSVSNESANNLEKIGVLAKAVSPISIQTSSMPVDQYGKRVYMPTRVDFPEVSITMYDDIGGKMFDLCANIYSKFFHNNSSAPTGMNAEEVLTGVGHHGRKLPESKHNYYHQHFEKLTIYHFFGNLDNYDDQEIASGSRTGSPIPKNAGTGTLQKIEIVNPLVTSMQFSGSDYSATELRTVDLSLQPENIVIGKPEEVAFPHWMTLGMNYMMDTLVPLDNKTGKFEAYPAKGDYIAEFFDNNLSEGEVKEKEERRKEQDAQDTQRKLQELMKLYNANLKTVEGIDNFYLYGNEEGNEEARAALKERIGVINAAQANRYTKEPTKTYVDDFNKRDEGTIKSTYLNPDVPSFGEIGSSNPPINKYPPAFNTNIDDAMVQELVGSFFGQRDFNVNNVFNLKQQLRTVANSINTNITNGVSNALGNALKIDGASVIDGAMRPVKRPAPPTGTTEKAFRDFPLEENVNLINTGNHSGVSKVIKTWNGSGPE